MNISFVETENIDTQYFEAELAGHDLSFVDALEEARVDTEILSIYIHSRIDSESLVRLPSLRFIATRSGGFDHIDLAECARRGVVVSNASGTDSNTVAEHTFALMLAVSRRLLEVREANKQPRFSYQKLRGFDLRNKTLGIVGTGRIGLRVAHIGLAFGMKVLGFDPHRRSQMAEIAGLRYVPLDDLLRESNVISLHAPLTPETHHMINAEAFAKCRHGVVIVNTARGGLIETPALIAALDAGIIAGVGIDVLDDERVMRKEDSRLIADQIIERLQAVGSEEESLMRNPERIKDLQEILANNGLLSRPNVVFTPHVAFNSVEAVQRINAATVENIRAFVTGKPANLVNLPAK